MADVIAATFDGPDEAEATLRTIRSLESADKVKPSDTAVVRKDADGKVTIHNEAGSGTEAGAVVGAVLGGVLFVVFPLAGIAGGAAIGGLIGRAAAPGIDGKWVKEVGDDLPAGGSALFLQIRGGEAGLVLSGSVSTRAGSSRPRSRTSSGPAGRCRGSVSSAERGDARRPGPRGTPEDALPVERACRQCHAVGPAGGAPTLDPGADLERRDDRRARPRFGARGTGDPARGRRRGRRLDRWHGRSGGGDRRARPARRAAPAAGQRRRLERPQPRPGARPRRVAGLPRCRRPAAPRRARRADGDRPPIRPSAPWSASASRTTASGAGSRRATTTRMSASPAASRSRRNPRLMYYASIHGKVFHRSLIRGLEFEGRVLGDQPWTIRALLRAGDGIEVIGETVYEWTHPHPDHWVETITSATKASAGRAADMARMAPTRLSRGLRRGRCRDRGRGDPHLDQASVFRAARAVRSERPGPEGARPARSGDRAPVRGDRRVPRRGAGRDRRDLQAPGRARPAATGQDAGASSSRRRGRATGRCSGRRCWPTDGWPGASPGGGRPAPRSRSIGCSLHRSARRPHRRSCLVLGLPTRVRRRLRRR